MKKIIFGLTVLALSYTTFTLANELVSKSTAGAKAYIISPANGETVPQTFNVQFGLVGMGVAPAGIKKEKTGHHHLLIDTDIQTIDLSKPLPATDKIKHFGGGQTETTLQLAPGKHTLQLLLGNYVHIPHSKAVISKKITVIIE